MATRLTTNLGLRIADTLSSDAVYNLERIDTLASVLVTDAAGNRVLQSTEDIYLQPQSSDIGGSGTGGTIRLGSVSEVPALIDIYATLTQFNGPVSLTDVTTSESEIRFSDGSNYVGLTAPDSVPSSLTWKLPDSDGTASQVLQTDGSGQLGWATVQTDTLTAGHIRVGSPGGEATEVDTASFGDIQATTAGGLTYKAGSIFDADISATAAVSLSKLATLTADRALVSGPSGLIQPAAATTRTEVGYLAGVTGSIQAQLDVKLEGNRGTSTTWITADGTSKVVSHGLSSSEVLVAVYDESSEQILPDTVTVTDANTVTLTSSQAPATSWTVVVVPVG